MSYVDYLITKAIVLAVIVFAVNLVYAFIFGRTIEEVLRDKQKAQSGPPRR